jgi:hypothetical protein
MTCLPTGVYGFGGLFVLLFHRVMAPVCAHWSGRRRHIRNAAMFGLQQSGSWHRPIVAFYLASISNVAAVLRHRRSVSSFFQLAQGVFIGHAVMRLWVTRRDAFVAVGVVMVTMVTCFSDVM